MRRAGWPNTFWTSAWISCREYDAGRVDGESDLRHAAVLVGGTLDAGSGCRERGGFESGAGDLLSDAVRARGNSRRSTSPTTGATGFTNLAGVDKNRVLGRDGHDAGSDIAIELAHPDFGALTAATERLKRALASYAGVSQVVDSHTEGKRELRLRLRPEAGALGITETDLAVQVRSAFYGAEALRITRGRNELKVMVRYPDAVRRRLSAIDEVMLRTPDGREIPFREAAFVEEGLRVQRGRADGPAPCHRGLGDGGRGCRQHERDSSQT